MFRSSKEKIEKKDKKPIPEDFSLTHEAKFNSPRLEQRYWANPNSQRADIARCTYGIGGIEHEVKYTEGV